MARLTPDERRTMIVDAALAVARRKGLAATTVREVAREMGASSGLIHHYFPTMDDVLAAAFDRVAGEDLQRTSRALDGTAEPISALAAFLGSYAPVDSDWAFLLWLDAWAEAPRRPALRATSQRLNLAWQALLEAIIRRGLASGEMTTADPHAAAWTILSLLDGLALQVVAHEAVIDRVEMLVWASRTAERELGMPSGTLRIAERLAKGPGA